MMYMRLGLPLFFCILSFKVIAQTFGLEDFEKRVWENNPIVFQADLYRDQARSALLRAKGGFDPKAYASHLSKDFNGKTYFRYTETGVKVPTWAGLEIKGAYNWASGDFLNTEKKLPKKGQATLGLEWALGQGLFFDERRAGLQLAYAGLEMGEAERLALRNDLMLDATKAYWSWVYAGNAVGIAQNALQQAQIRHAGLRESFAQGDKPAIDTLETYIQLQTRMVDLQFARNEQQNTALGLLVFLQGKDGQTPSDLSLPNPPVLSTADIRVDAPVNVDNLLQIARTHHPDLQKYQVKLRQLAIEQRLKNEKRKPQLDLSYYLLGDGWQFFPTATSEGPGVLANDIKWGLEFSYPLPNRKARGDWQVTKIKIAQTELELQQKQQLIASKVQQYANDLQNLRAQALLFRDISANYGRLLEAENEKFKQGESSIFLINTREQRWLDAQLKYLKLISELRKAEAGLEWAVGALGN